MADKLLRALPVLVLAAVAFFAGLAIRGKPEVATRTDTVRVAPADYESTKAELALVVGEVGGLRARLRGLEKLQPARIIIVDSVTVKDTVFITVNARGQLTYQFLPGGPMGVAELRTGIDVSRCDDGYQIRDRQVVCDRARLGHLYVGPWLARRPMLAAWWTPSYRSPWEAYVGFSGAWEFGLRRGVEIW